MFCLQTMPLLIEHETILTRIISVLGRIPKPSSGPEGIRTPVQNISTKLSTCLCGFTIFINTILCVDVASTWWSPPPYESLQHHYNCQICPRHCPLVNNTYYFELTSVNTRPALLVSLTNLRWV